MRKERGMANHFYDIPYEPVSAELWHVGALLPDATEFPELVPASTKWLAAGAPFELETALAARPEDAAFAAAVAVTRLVVD